MIAGVVIIESDLNNIFDYQIPNHLNSDEYVGKRVLVEFGKRKMTIGMIVYVKEYSDVENNKLKNIEAIIDDEPIITDELIKLAFNISKFYAISLSQAFNLLIPVFINRKDLYVISRGNKFINKHQFDLNFNQLLLVKHLENGEFSFNSKKNICSEVEINDLIIKGVIKIKIPEFKNEDVQDHIITKQNFILTEQQNAAINSIIEYINLGEYKNILLHGVTGSGKTEVYLQSIKYVIEKGKNVLLLVPEISLTPQIIEYIHERISEKIAVIHSKMNDKERLNQWMRIKKQKIRLVIGPRSAVFTPIKDLGLIIIDEAHEISYKSEENPRINAVEVAQMRAKINQIPIVLASATPSIEHYYLANKGLYKMIKMENRVNNKLPIIEVIDMKKELENGNNSIFSFKLLNEIKKNLENKEQSIIFLNRRGFANFVICKKCGYIFRCENCSISLTYHKSGLLKCHYCGHNQKFEWLCPQCNSKYLFLSGSGTQKAEEEIHKIFPQARILRMDRDTTYKKNAYEQILRRFKNKEADILIGTQMIAKGLHFPDLTLVGVLNADLLTNMPDFRAKERAFQLITQVSGRAGRSNKEGRVIIQTLNPADYSIVCSQIQDYNIFYNNEITFRKMLNYPPFSYIANFIFTSDNENDAKEASERVKKMIEELNIQTIEVYGPNECLVYKIKNIYRWQVFIKMKNLSQLSKVANYVKSNYKSNKANLIIDINPVNLY